MNIKIYQIDQQKDKNNVKFTGYDELPKYQQSAEIDASLYTEVFSGETESETLEGVYRDFNTKPQPLHRGHSLSVSDIVKTDDGTFYCDRVGFRKVEFDESKTYKPDNLLKIVYVEPNKPAIVAEIEPTLKAEQHAVLGRIQELPNDDDTVLIMNEEAKHEGLKGNRRIGENVSAIIAGPFFIVGVSGSEFRSLNEQEIEKYMSRFKEPEEISDEEVREDTGIKFFPL